MKDARIPSLTTGHGQKVSQFHKALKARSGETLRQLQVCVFFGVVIALGCLDPIRIDRTFPYMSLRMTLSGIGQRNVWMSTSTKKLQL